MDYIALAHTLHVVVTISLAWAVFKLRRIQTDDYHHSMACVQMCHENLQAASDWSKTVTEALVARKILKPVEPQS